MHRFWSAIVLAFVCLTPFASAQTPAATATDGRWHFAAGLYGFFPAIEGSLSTRNFDKVPIDVSFSELWDHLQMNLTGHIEARHDRFGFGVDLFYVRLAAPIPGQIPEFLNLSVNLRQFIAESFGFYRVAQGSGERPWTVDALGGVRVWDTNTRLEADLDIVDPDGQTLAWADGFGGVRVQIPLHPRLSLLGRGDVGAGGARLDWSASGDLAFASGKGWLLGLGYRTLNIEYDKEGREGRTRRLLDVGYNGPRSWVVYTW